MEAAGRGASSREESGPWPPKNAVSHLWEEVNARRRRRNTDSR